MLTVLFKLLRGRTKVLSRSTKERSSLLPRDDFLPRIVACAAEGDENFSLKGQDAVTWLRGIPSGISRIIYRPVLPHAERRRCDGGVRGRTFWINDLGESREEIEGEHPRCHSSELFFFNFFFSFPLNKFQGKTFNCAVFCVKRGERGTQL